MSANKNRQAFQRGVAIIYCLSINLWTCAVFIILLQTENALPTTGLAHG